MSDKFTFNFNSTVWKNQRSLIRKLGVDSLWYKVLKSILSILNERAVRLSWLYRQMWLETSDGFGLILWGTRYKIEKLPGETDDLYRNRLLLAKLFKMSIASVSSKRQVIQFSTGLDPEEIRYSKIYKSEEAKNCFTMGGILDQRMMSRKYVLFRYRFFFPKLSDSFNRSALVQSIENVNIGGNVCELWENQGEFDPFVMGGNLTGQFHSRRAEKIREYSVY
ncbi:hypothetical protein ACO2J1_02340 [Leptospira interrogans]|uniref:hypothetical protein n=1 Tax=Leptospira interrogans TaxID=173 RepID=UPI0002925618|nr:hypothetical protein [Leptospira interrogans]ASV04952.1 hypothetical protein B2G47_01025 [Leptospira interrogans serovar Canicola]ASV08789.1 hypothetical protein B2G50_07325 [Leptospira interrogans serovar Canicola]EKO70756.1 hypothetical protein LEP1GSC069_4524 [Leptospira interrogans serovar Canicola str. Fiocruz LV133]EMK15846.1 hypothetical protein LEP1GSC075_1303 [Leptospira interrogans str. Kito]EMN76143.1 hypothetical protein LEP1GSC102_0703 [Leptospira interrogans str. UI 09600]